MYAPPPPGQRERLLNEIVGDFSQDPAVVGIFLAGSLAAGTADAHSDIDLRVVVAPDAIADYYAKRLERPRRWTGFLFNEWGEDNSCCVSHFEHFAKVDIYYIAADQVLAWLRATTPIRVIHDPSGIVAIARRDARMSPVEPSSFVAVEQSVSKATAYAIEVARRLARGELIYAQTLLDDFRDRLVVLEDLLEGHGHAVARASQLEKQPKEHVARPFVDRCDVTEPVAVQAALADLARACRTTVSQLHERSLLKSSPTPFLHVLDQLAASEHPQHDVRPQARRTRLA